MKRTITVLLIAFAMMLSMTVYTDTAYADTDNTSFITIKADTWTPVKESTDAYDDNTGEYIYTDYIYKIKVPSHGYITVSLKNNNYAFYVYDHYKTAEDNHHVFEGYSSDKSCKIAVDKGTYYIRAYTNGKTQIKYSFKSAKAYPNYCRAKARKLSAGKTVTVAISKKHKYDRWYKIQLKSKRRISVWSSYGESVHIYDSRFKRIDLEQAGTKSTKYTTKKQKKGTYYICIDAFDYDNSYQGKHPVITLKWK